MPSASQLSLISMPGVPLREHRHAPCVAASRLHARRGEVHVATGESVPKIFVPLSAKRIAIGVSLGVRVAERRAGLSAENRGDELSGADARVAGLR